MQQRNIIVMARVPREGRVKTRLAVGIGNEKALEVYTSLLRYTLEVVASVDSYRFLYLDGESEALPESAHLTCFEIRKQTGSGLGEKMYHALRAHTSDNRPTLIIGTDCPYLKAGHLEQAFDALNDTDFVIGPARDGGYYLLGGRSFPEELFNNMSWSTPMVFRETVLRITGLLASYRLLEPLSDIDDEASLQKWEDSRMF